MDDALFMQAAIEHAMRGKNKPGCGEVGAVIVLDGQVVAGACNEAELRHDPTAHAEIVALRQLGQALRTTDFRGCTLYSTLQCCGMCTLACVWAKISRIVYGASREDVHRMYFDEQRLGTLDLIRDAYRDDVIVVPGVLKEACASLYYRPWDNPPEDEQKNI